MSKLETMNNLAFELTNEDLEPHEQFENAKRIYELSKPIQLNENQQMVLDWMKKEFPIMGVDTVLSELTFLSCTGGMLKNKVTATAWRILSDIERLQVLQAFAEWELNHDRN